MALLYWCIQWPIYWYHLLAVPEEDTEELPRLGSSVQARQQLEDTRYVPTQPPPPPSHHPLSSPTQVLRTSSSMPLVRSTQALQPPAPSGPSLSKPCARPKPTTPETTASLVPLDTLIATPQLPAATRFTWKKSTWFDQGFKPTPDPEPVWTGPSRVFCPPTPSESDSDEESRQGEELDIEQWQKTLSSTQVVAFLKAIRQFKDNKEADKREIQDLRRTKRTLMAKVASSERTTIEARKASSDAQRLGRDFEMESHLRETAEQKVRDLESQLHENGNVTETQKWVTASEELARRLGAETMRAQAAELQVKKTSNINKQLEAENEQLRQTICQLESTIQQHEASADELKGVKAELAAAKNDTKLAKDAAKLELETVKSKTKLIEETAKAEVEAAKNDTELVREATKADMTRAEDVHRENCNNHILTETDLRKDLKQANKKIGVLQSQIDTQNTHDIGIATKLEAAQSDIKLLRSQLEEHTTPDAEMEDVAPIHICDHLACNENLIIQKREAAKTADWQKSRIKDLEAAQGRAKTNNIDAIAAAVRARKEAVNERDACRTTLAKRTSERDASLKEVNDHKVTVGTLKQDVVALEHQVQGLQGSLRTYAESGNVFATQVPGVSSLPANQGGGGGRKKRGAEEEEEVPADKLVDSKQSRIERPPPVAKQAKGPTVGVALHLLVGTLQPDKLKGKISREVGDQIEEWFGNMAVSTSRRPGMLASALQAWIKYAREDFEEVKNACETVAVHIDKISPEDLEDRGLMLFAFWVEDFTRKLLEKNVWTSVGKSKMAQVNRCAAKILAYGVAAGVTSSKDPIKFYGM